MNINSSINIPQYYLKDGKKIKLGDKTYVAWYNPKHKAINVQDLKNYTNENQENKISFNINEADGQITAIWLNGSNLGSSIPKEYHSMVKLVEDYRYIHLLHKMLCKYGTLKRVIRLKNLQYIHQVLSIDYGTSDRFVLHPHCFHKR